MGLNLFPPSGQPRWACDTRGCPAGPPRSWWTPGSSAALHLEAQPSSRTVGPTASIRSRASGAELLSPAESSGLHLPWLPAEGKRREVLLLILELPGGGLVVWAPGFPAFPAVAQIQSLVGEWRPTNPQSHQREKKPDSVHKKYKTPRQTRLSHNIK